MTQKTRDKIRRIKKAVEADLLARPGVTGVDINYKKVGGKTTGALAIVIYVKKKYDAPDTERIPSAIDGVPTDVVELTFKPF